jgi:hypothetical protein
MATATAPETMTEELAAKVEAFRALMEKDRNEYTARVHPTLQASALEAGRRGYHHVTVTGGNRRFVKVFDYTNTDNRHKDSGRIAYFVEVETGKIFGARSLAAYNPARQFGTLDTINEWYWGDYYGKHRTITDFDKATLVPKAERVRRRG